MAQATSRYYAQADFSGGINQFPEKATKNQVLDAQNVWAPNRAVERRPGLSYAGGVVPDAVNSVSPIAYQTVWGGTVTPGTPPDTWQVLYFKAAVLPSAFGVCTLGEPLSDGRRLIWQYMCTAGSWLPLPGYDWYLAGATIFFKCWYPADLDSGATYNVRCITANMLSYDGGVSVFDSGSTQQTYLGLAQARTISGQYWVSALTDNAGRPDRLYLQSGLTSGVSTALRSGPLSISAVVDRTPSIAVIPDFDVIYYTVGGTVYDCSPSTSDTIVPAAVNVDPDIVGPRANGVTPPYSSDVLALDAAFPAAQLLCYFSGLLFTVVDNYTVKWSAPAVDGAYNVWPSLNFETIADNDNSPIIAIAPLNEQLVVYKRDSVYVMTPGPPDPSDVTQQATFQPTRIVSGIGCIAAGSVQSCRGVHIFRARDGWYSFNGSQIPQKISGPIDTLAKSIEYGTASTMTSADWAIRHCYVVSCDMASGRTTFVYDYDNGSWWVWTGLDAKFWVAIEKPDYSPALYMCGSLGMIAEFGLGLDDLGADIPAYITTHRMNEHVLGALFAREVRTEALASAGSLDVELIYGDEEGTAQSVSLTASQEPVWGTALWDRFVWTPNRRRERKIKCRGPVARWYQLKISSVAASQRRFWSLFGVTFGFGRAGVR